MKYAGIVLMLLLAACGDDPLGPADLQDPAALQGELASAASAFESEAFASFGAVTDQLGPTPLAPVVPFLAAAPGPFVSRARRAERLRALAPPLDASVSRGPIIDNALYGHVYRWDATNDQYAWIDSETVTGLNGVRFILYRVDEFGTVIEPVVEVGYVDLIDESSGSTESLRIRVRGTGGTPTYLDYLATATETQTSVTITAVGSVTNGLAAAANKTLSFNVSVRVSFSVAGITARLHAVYTLNSPSITIDLTETFTFSETADVISIDFRIIRPAEVVRLLGRMTFSEDLSMDVDLEVRVNGGIVASIDGDPFTAQWVDAGGEPLGTDDLEALDALFQASTDFDEAVGQVLEPTTNFFGVAT